MKSLSSLGIGLSLVFGCLLLALIAELYYLLWWKRRITNRDFEDGYTSSGRDFFYLFCWKRPSSLSSTALNPQQLCTSGRMTDAHVHDSENQLDLNSKDFLLKPFEENDLDTELMRLHNLAGPPRFLFTIKEETKEDLESEDGKSTVRGDKRSRTRSLSDILLTVETPYLTPLSSPPFFTPPLTPMETYNHHGFNPLFESSTDAEVNIVKSSPPPKFKFLKDAEEKLYRRKLLEQAEKRMKTSTESFQDEKRVASPYPPPPPPPPFMPRDEADGSYITINMGKKQEKELQLHHHHHSSSSQVLPLSSSPSTYKKPLFQ